MRTRSILLKSVQYLSYIFEDPILCVYEDPILQQKQLNNPVPKRAPLSQSFTMETMLSFADSSSSQDEADDEEESEEEEKENKVKEDWVKATDCEDLTNGKAGGHRSLSLVRTEFSSQPDLPTFIQVSFCLHLSVSFNIVHLLGLHLPRSLSWRLHP